MIFAFMTSVTIAAPLVVDFVDGTSLEAIEQMVDAPCRWVHEKSADESLAYIDKEMSEADIETISQLAEVEAIEFSVPMVKFDAPNDPFYDRQWNLHRIGMESAWTKANGKGVVIGVLDTGYAPVADMAPSTVKKGASFVPTEKETLDLNGHGTHVIGTLAQFTDNGIGVAGIANQASIIPIKVLDQYGAGQSEWVATGIDEAVDRGAQVINLSLGGQNSKVLEVAIQKALDAGVLIVAAAGNSGKEGVSAPANIDGVIAVGATGPNDAKTPYSNWGDALAIMAPGGDKRKENGGILQNTIPIDGEDYQELQGTSMAAPHVTATIALLLSANAGDSNHIKDILFESATDLGNPGWDSEYGHGRLNAAAALNRVSQDRATRFLAAALIGGGLAIYVGAPMGILSVALSGLLAGGLFFFPWLRIAEPDLFTPMLSQFGDGFWSNALLRSALIPIVVTVLTLPILKLRWLSISVGVAWATHLFAGAIDGQLPNSEFSGTVWYAINAGLSLSAALFVTAVHQVMGDKHAI